MLIGSASMARSKSRDDGTIVPLAAKADSSSTTARLSRRIREAAGAADPCLRGSRANVTIPLRLLRAKWRPALSADPCAIATRSSVDRLPIDPTRFRLSSASDFSFPCTITMPVLDGEQGDVERWQFTLPRTEGRHDEGPGRIGLETEHRIGQGESVDLPRTLHEGSPTVPDRDLLGAKEVERSLGTGIAHLHSLERHVLEDAPLDAIDREGEGGPVEETVRDDPPGARARRTSSGDRGRARRKR